MDNQELEQKIKDEKTAVLIVNTHSRRGENLFFRAMDGLEARGIMLAAAYPVRNPKRLPEFVKEAIARGHKLIIIGGGDGTISSAVDFFIEKDIIL
jgi:diacylglycerol kinase family enzyme